MRKASPGELLPRRTSVGLTLISSPQSRRLQETLHDLIMLAYQQSTGHRGNSLSLSRLEYVSGEKNGAKYCMHLDALVKDHERNENTPLKVTLSAEVVECSENY